MGTLKTHAHYESARHDRPGEWTCEDVEAAKLRGDAYGRPRGADGPTPDKGWENGVRFTEADRVHLREVYEREYQEEAERRGILALIGPNQNEKHSIDRAAISRALIKCGFLHVRRRRMTPPISQQKKAGNS